MHRTSRMSTVILATAILLPGISRSAMAFPESPLADVAALEQSGFRPYWTIHIPLTSGESIRTAHLVDANIYVVSDDGVIFSVEAATGLIRWADKLTEAQYRIYRPTEYRTIGGRAVVAIPYSGGITIFDRYTGDRIQRFSLPFPDGSAAVGYDGRLFLGSTNGRMYSIFPTPRMPSGFVELWEVAGGAPITSAPLFDYEDYLVFAARNGSVFSCSPTDKALHWSHSLGVEIQADLAVDLGGIYIASMNRTLTKLNSHSGRLEWRMRFPWELNEAPAVVARTVYQYCKTQGLTAIDADTGSERWRLAEGRNLAAHSGDRDFVFTTDGRLLIVDHVNGSTVGSISATATQFALANVDDDAIYLFGADGDALCIRPDSVPYLRRQQILAAQKQLNTPPESRSADNATSATSTVPSQEDSDPFRSRWDRKKK